MEKFHYHMFNTNFMKGPRNGTTQHCPKMLNIQLSSNCVYTIMLG